MKRERDHHSALGDVAVLLVRRLEGITETSSGEGPGDQRPLPASPIGSRDRKTAFGFRNCGCTDAHRVPTGPRTGQANRLSNRTRLAFASSVNQAKNLSRVPAAPRLGIMKELQIEMADQPFSVRNLAQVLV